MRASGPEL